MDIEHWLRVWDSSKNNYFYYHVLEDGTKHQAVLSNEETDDPIITSGITQICKCLDCGAVRYETRYGFRRMSI